jgi:hypothetical protein
MHGDLGHASRAMIFIEAINEGNWQFGMWKGVPVVLRCVLYSGSKQNGTSERDATASEPEGVNAAEH